MNIQSQFQGNGSSLQLPQQIEEVTIAIAIKNFNPTMVSAEFLQMSGIVPADWELGQNPVVNPNGVQIIYKNGVKIIAQAGVISFIEGLGNKQITDLQFANLAARYAEKLSNAEYQGLSISPKIITPLSGDETAGKKFINQELLKQGSWSNFEGVEAQAAINLFYQLKDYSLAVNINPARLQQQNNMVIPALLFAGNFTYKFDPNQSNDGKLKTLMTTITRWQERLDTFRVLVNEQFLHKGISSQESLFN